LLARAHAAGRKVLISVGGAGSHSGFQGATAPAQFSDFVGNIVEFVSARGYDGVDIDWEPLGAADEPQYTAFIQALRSALDALAPRPLIMTAAVASRPALFALLQSQFDQINLMTYDLSGPWPGWVTWFNAPIFDGGYRFPSTSGLVPSTDGMVNEFIAAGVAPAKLGIGIAFYGIVWTGVSAPRQSWTTPPTTAAATYHAIMSNHYQPQRYRWDTNAQAAWLSIDNSGTASDQFISYDDEHTCQAKISYARNRGLGGVMIWELGSGYRATQPPGQRDPLLQAVKDARAAPRFVGIERAANGVELGFTSLPLASYRIQWTSNLATLAWTTLTNNVSGTGGVLHVTDPSPAALTRFYRVQTPP
jgi:chitinase